MDPKTSKTMEFESVSVQETWSAMERLVEKGLVRSFHYQFLIISLLLNSGILGSVTLTHRA